MAKGQASEGCAGNVYLCLVRMNDEQDCNQQHVKSLECHSANRRLHVKIGSPCGADGSEIRTRRGRAN